jgi:hypothetical protein
VFVCLFKKNKNKKKQKKKQTNKQTNKQTKKQKKTKQNKTKQLLVFGRPRDAFREKNATDFGSDSTLHHARQDETRQHQLLVFDTLPDKATDLLKLEKDCFVFCSLAEIKLVFCGGWM